MKEHLLRASVRWADGTYDHKRPCEICGDENCLYPVYKDYYREIKSRHAWEQEQVETDRINNI